jgi:protein TonB
VSPPAEQNPVARQAEATNNTGVSVLTAAPGAGGVPGEGQVPTGASAPAGSGGQAGPSDTKGSSHGGNIYANSGARAIVRPEPQIPDDLREKAFKFTVQVLFHVAVDGSVKVELAKPTPDPRLNRILLDTYGKWRWIPKVVNGKPVASTEEIDLNLEVK